jgi:hypothetical protein
LFDEPGSLLPDVRLIICAPGRLTFGWIGKRWRLHGLLDNQGRPERLLGIQRTRSSRSDHEKPN